MKQLSITLMVLSLLCSCGNKKDKKTEDTIEKQPIEKSEKAPNETNKANEGLNLEDLPVSTAELGDFPFLGFPDGFKLYGSSIERSKDVLYVPIKGIMTPFEGRVWKADISSMDENGDDWSLPEFFKNYGETITNLGGTRIFDGEISYEEYERYHGNAAYMGETGSIGYVGERIQVYAIHHIDGANVLIQLTGNTISGKLNVLQMESSQ